MSFTEHVLMLHCQGEALVGVVSKPDYPLKLGVIVVVGGPQYRVGSHRQFVLLARCLASTGYPVLRFDYRGMGDSKGAVQRFDAVDDDIATAIDALQTACPEVDRVVLWGLCDGATASVLYCETTDDVRVAGLCLLNPWVRSDATLARTHLKHYYIDRLLQGTFWRKLLLGEFEWMRAIKGLWGNVLASRGHPQTELRVKPFQNRMAMALRKFSGKILLILSANDFTAKEFVEFASTDPLWRGALDSPDLQRVEIAGADHTFSSRQWRTITEQVMLNWMANLKEIA
jgi:exosortase A-associated hydrolase 1